MWRASILTIFPEMFPGRSRKPRGQALAAENLVARSDSTSAIMRPTSTAGGDTPAAADPDGDARRRAARAIDAAANDGRRAC